MRAPRSFMAGLTVCGYVKGLAGVSSLQPTAPIVDFLFCLILGVTVSGLEFAFQLLSISIDLDYLIIS